MIPNILQRRDNGIVSNEPWLVASRKKTDEVGYHQLHPSIIFVSANWKAFLCSPFTRFRIFVAGFSLDN